MIFESPVRGPLHPNSWKRPKNNRDFRVTQPFGPTKITAEPTVEWSGGDDIPPGIYRNFHEGIDLGDQRCTSAVRAAAEGRVDFAGVDGTRNRVVIVNHGDDKRTWYGHLSSESVRVGQRVKAGHVIGTVGDSGNAIGCHLHFAYEVSADGKGQFRFRDPWPRLAQNVTVHPVNEPGINIRLIPDTGPDTIYAVTRSDGLIHRTSDEADLGPIVKERKWGGTVTGKRWELPDGTTGRDWDRILLDDDYRFLASALARRSAS